MSASRRSFLHKMAASTALLGALPAVAAADSVQEHLLSPDFPGADDVGKFDEALASELSATGQQQQANWDTSWTQRITAKHRAVFDAPELEGGAGVYRAGIWRQHYRSVLGATDSDISMVLVVRHAAIPLIMNNTFWEQYEVAKQAKTKHPITEKKLARNPVLLEVERDGIPQGFATYAIDKQIATGTIVLACALAFQRIVGMVAEKDKVTAQVARERAMAAVVPGVILQPSGIFAVMMAQEAGCHFIRAS